jgi:transketolase
MADTKLDQLCVNTIRMLSLDQVQQANAGHPGMPLSASPALYAVWDRFLKHNPENPTWIDRDRFVLSAGHACAMLYAALHLYGYDLPIDELKRFRQLDSRTPGHPEFGHTPGVEATTGPLGQGLSNAVGMALAEAHLAEMFHREGHEIVDHHTFVLASDGDLMEGLTSEASSLAGFLGLGKLIVIYDDNGISIEGHCRELAYDEATRKRYEAYGWQVIEVEDGRDVEALAEAVEAAKAETRQPTLIRMITTIGEGSPVADTHGVHGAPLTPEHAVVTKTRCGWSEDHNFHVPDEAAAHFAESAARGAKAEAQWKQAFADYKAAHPELAARFEAMAAGALPEGWEDDVPVFDADDATRNAGGKVMNAIAKRFDGYLVGGSADLAPSTKTLMTELGHVGPGAFGGSNLHFGVREHAMAAVCNGMAYHGGLRPFGATFLVFSDYCRPSIRLSALSGLPVIYVFTHDSIGVGEDGPTHQPVEHVAALRAIPNLNVFRPADPNETAVAWKEALKRTDGPTALALTRQKVKCLAVDAYPVADAAKGGYVLSDCEGDPDLLLLATGSEVEMALEAQKVLAGDGMKARVVSLPCWEIFDAQEAAYRERVLPAAVKARLAVEAGVRMGWEKYVGEVGDTVTMSTFGDSGKFTDVQAKHGFTVENIVARAKAVVERAKKACGQA